MPLSKKASEVWHIDDDNDESSPSSMKKMSHFSIILNTRSPSSVLGHIVLMLHMLYSSVVLNIFYGYSSFINYPQGLCIQLWVGRSSRQDNQESLGLKVNSNYGYRRSCVQINGQSTTTWWVNQRASYMYYYGVHFCYSVMYNTLDMPLYYILPIEIHWNLMSDTPLVIQATYTIMVQW